MKEIELKYNPFLPETKIFIDGETLSDEYSMLFPVMRYPLQSWLKKRGSWSGLVYHLVALTRGEKFQFVFCGRKIDYEDLKSTLENDKRLITMEKISWKEQFDTNTILTKLRGIERMLDSIWTRKYVGVDSNRDNRIINKVEKTFQEKNQLSQSDAITINIENLYDSLNLINNNANLVIVKGHTDDIDAKKIRDICSRTMHRPYESVVFYDKQEQVYYGYDEDGLYKNDFDKKTLINKYVIPYKVQNQYRLFCQLLDAYEEILNNKEKIKNDFKSMKNCDDIPDEEYNVIASCMKWMNNNEEKIIKSRKLLEKLWEEA